MMKEGLDEVNDTDGTLDPALFMQSVDTGHTITFIVIVVVVMVMVAMC